MAKSVNFLAELSKRELPVQPVPYSTHKNSTLYYVDINKHPKESYWTDWGGSYDNVTGNILELYYAGYLQRVGSFSEVCRMPNSIYTNNRIVIFNIPKHPWLFAKHETSCENIKRLLFCPLDPDNPSNNILDGENVPVRLAMPDVNVKLSDEIAGTSLLQEFSLEFSNNEGKFDDDIEWNLFNTPLYLKKAAAEKPGIADFKLIRNGLVSDISVTLKDARITASDAFRSLEEPVCEVITREMFPDVEITNENALGKNLPVLYGAKRIKPEKLNDRQYAVPEGAFLFSEARDRNGDDISINEYSYDPETKTLNVEPKRDPETGKEIIPEIDTVLAVGYTHNRLGEIILDIISQKTKIHIFESTFNLEEVNRYASGSVRAAIEFTGGDVRKAIQTVLKNDMAFFIQQSDGRFTIRKYGEEYATHNISKWTLTQVNSKDSDAAQQQYFSSCVINYNYQDDKTYKSLLYKEMEEWAEETYRKKIRREFSADLVLESDALKLAALLSKRYTPLKKTLKIASGEDTSGFQLADTVTLDATINGREFAGNKKYFIKEINHAQDILSLEEV